ncbi:MAG TPA: carboxypeptidase M32, partial [Rhizomicrobium sp.]|nr:carboxypeptidase M32 [Rhizomicrobium sp.]
LLAHDPSLVIELPQDQRDLFVQLLIDHARAMGRASCQLCLVEPKYEADGPEEQEALRRYLAERHGLVIAHADPRELSVRDGEVYYEDIRVDIAYRDYEMRDLIALERELGRKLDGMRLLFRENRVISSLVGDFDHKSGFEILTDKRIAERFFPPDDCRLFQRHILWTRVVSERNATLPDGSPGDLPEYVRRHREQLVLKPNRAYGGEGVTIGAATEAHDWEKLIDRAIAGSANPDETWVVQSATNLPVAEFPVIGQGGRVYSEPFYAVMGFAPTDNGLGVLCRVSQKQVVNVAQHGGMAALLVGELPKTLEIPKRPLKGPDSAKETFRRQIAELRHLEHTISLLEWDEEVMQPVAGRALRGEQVATLEGLRHNILTSDRLADLIADVAAGCEGEADLAREIELLRRERARAMAVPEDIVRNLAAARSQTFAAWEEAREKNEFSIFAVPFSQLLKLVRERAQALASNSELYDALLDEYEPGMSRARLDPIFAEMRERLVPIVRGAAPAPKPRADQRFPAAAQWELSRRILAAIGFDFARGRLDASAHPFTSIAGESDVRVTGRVDERDFWNAILTMLHEGGHALYDQGFRARDKDSLLADGASAGMHEGQARLWENHVGRSRAFFDFVSPYVTELFPGLGRAEIERSWRATNAVRPGAIRVDCDEVTYHLHIILRYELENALLAGEFAVSELPHHWDSRSAELIGVRPANAREGALQDVHWAVGMFGYFPTYTIGSLYAAQLVKTYSQSRDLGAEIRKGEFAGLRGWLAKNIYEAGNRFSAEEIVSAVTGLGLDSAAFFEHIAAAEK